MRQEYLLTKSLSARGDVISALSDGRIKLMLHCEGQGVLRVTKKQSWKAKLEKMKKSPGIWSQFSPNFQKYLSEKDRNINLDNEFPFKIANISLQEHNFPGMRFPNSTFFSMHGY